MKLREVIRLLSEFPDVVLDSQEVSGVTVTGDISTEIVRLFDRSDGESFALIERARLTADKSGEAP